MCQTWFLAAAGLMFIATVAQADEKSPTPTFKEVKQILSAHCTTCHSDEMSQHGIHDPPAGIRLDTVEQIRAFTKEIIKTVVQDRSMPPAKTTDTATMTEGERQTIATWYAAGAKIP